MKDAIRQRALELGFDQCRFTTAAAPDHAAAFQHWLRAGHHGAMAYLERNAEKRLEPQRLLPGARSVICVVASYATATLASQTPHPSSAFVARYARFRDYHAVLGARLEELAAFINQLGGPNTRSRWYVDTGPVLEREFAQRAGLGFIGKHTNLISRRFGNWIFLGEILTTLELEPDAPEHNHCGRCVRCLDACPTRAILAPFQLDARRCISYLTIELKGPIPVELRPAIGNRVFGCDDCLAVCPWNRFAREGRLLRAHARPDLDAPDLLELLELDEAAFRARFAQTPLARVKRRGLRRNVCVALGNVGDAAALPALERIAATDEPLVAEHARWAMDQIVARAGAGSTALSSA
ncbi:MAG: tRNA epoxyqueuosine(34) reductase QueG [Verrucomicrobiae bacterium]|nr:tRNA epoxyqueuosine(34) reductase QueG [Verrucomicrobiae bacterium]